MESEKNFEDTPAIEFHGVSKAYDETNVLKDFSLSVDQGEFLGLLGPNGAGKTTAMHLATGLATISSGSIKIFGHDVVDDYREARKKIGIAPQEANFDRFFSILDCLIYQGGYFGLPSRKSKNRALELLEKFELQDKKESRPTELSGGEKRRLLIAKAMIHDPELIILDEPTASLDVELRHKLWEYLEGLKDEGKTTILTTHYIEEVEALAERVAILKNGELILSDTIQNVLEEYGRFQCILEVEGLNQEVVTTLQEKFPFLEFRDKKILARRRSFDSEIGDLITDLLDGGVSLEGLTFQETELEEIFLEAVGDN